MLILALNPGSTSLKLAIFKDKVELNREVIRFGNDVLGLEFNERSEVIKKTIEECVEKFGFCSADFDCVVARGGLLRNVSTGAYEYLKN